MTTHNPKQATEQLQTLLSNPLKKIGFLFGAGISMKDNKGSNLIPGVIEMTSNVVAAFPNDPQKAAIESIRVEILAKKRKFNIETLLSTISEKEGAVGSEKLCGLTVTELETLRKDIETHIKNMVSVHKTINSSDLNHFDFGKWVKNADKEFPVEIFTTNYDYLLELSLEENKVPYFDGFVGSYEAIFFPEWIEHNGSIKDWVKLWKLHGSLGWKRKDNGEIIRSSHDGDSAMIYPSYLKYDHSRKQPYLSYMDRLKKFLKQEDSVLFICGYSFGDEHINELILTSLNKARSSHAYILKAGELKESDDLAKEIALKNSKISIYAKNTAIIGCKFGNWKLSAKDEEIMSFKEVPGKSDPAWNGMGEFTLGDFKEFVDFLSNFYSHK